MNDDVETWLFIALRDAEPTRRAQLRAEILDHLAEASAAYQARGLDPAAARAAALADLGEPQHTARALRRAVPQPLAARLIASRTRWGLMLLLVLMALLARGVLLLPLSLSLGYEISPATGLALVLQVAALTLALSLPLLFDDLDLSAGAVVLLGIYLVRAPTNPHIWDFWLAGQPAALPPPAPLDTWNLWLNGQPGMLPLVVLGAALVGAAVGLIQGLLIVALRVPAPAVTLAGGVTLATLLLRQPGINQLSLGSSDRITTLTPTLVLFGLAGVLICLFALFAACLWQRPEPTPGSAPMFAYSRLIDLLKGAWLGLPVMLMVAHVLFSSDEARALPLVACMGGATMLGLAWAYQPADADVRCKRVQRLVRLVPAALLLSLGASILATWAENPSWVAGHLFMLLLAMPLAFLVALTMAIVLRALWGSRGRHWLGMARPSRQAALARVVALMLGSGLAAAVGGCIAAQGTRDGTTVHVAAFYVLLPLLGLIIGGQHRLPLALRPLGALLGGLVVAGATPLGGKHLDEPIVTAFVLAALFAGAWRLVLPPARAATMDDEPQHRPHLA